jgi:DNA invertase Pin-like site-specific DNA recombinase
MKGTNMSKTTKAIIFTKISRGVEASVTDQRQYDELIELATADGYTDITVIETRTPSGKPQFESLMKALESGEYGAIYVHSLSRISHNAGKLRDFFDKVDKTGTDLKIATLPQLSEETQPTKRIMLDSLAQLTERNHLDCSIRAVRGAYRGKEGMKI